MSRFGKVRVKCVGGLLQLNGAHLLDALWLSSCSLADTHFQHLSAGLEGSKHQIPPRNASMTTTALTQDKSTTNVFTIYFVGATYTTRKAFREATHVP